MRSIFALPLRWNLGETVPGAAVARAAQTLLCVKFVLG